MDSSWEVWLKKEFAQPYMQELFQFLQTRENEGAIIYPPSNLQFAAFNQTPFSQINVVILGQDPYHGEGQAHGLSFSVPENVKKPPSLVNILKEIEQSQGTTELSSGDLSSWAAQGVFLLNSVLTVEKGQPGSHQGKGWETFTDNVIERLNAERQGLVFMLWGNYAQKKGQLIDESKHCVLRAPHPSPLSAYRGFLGCEHFLKANNYLQQHNKKIIHW